MNAQPNNSGSSEYYNPQEAEKEVDRMVELAVKAAEKGENIGQLQDVMINSLPVKMRETLKKKFAAALAKRKLRPPVGEADIPPRGKLTRLRQIFAASAIVAMQKVAALMKMKPDLAKQVKQVGQALAKSGVALDKQSQVSEADLGNISPTAGVGTRGAQTGKGINS